MKIIHRIIEIGHTLITVLFIAAAGALAVFAMLELWRGITPLAATPVGERLNAILECIGLLTIAVAALELGQTILEEEVQREAQLSAPTRVRRFLSRFLVVVVVALSVETVVSVFNFAHTDPARLPQAAMVGIAAAALQAGWGVFVRLNQSAEALEPEAMAQAKHEDAEVTKSKE